MRLITVIVSACLILSFEGWADSDAKDAAKQQSEAAKTLHVPRFVTLKLGDGVSLKMVLIPAGSFTMGSPEGETTGKNLGPRSNEWPQHKVTITHPFYMAVYKTTQEEFREIMGTNPSKFPGQNYPVDAVTWDDADAFCRKASAKIGKTLTLPTEAQWEYAARAGTSAPWSFGDDESKLPEYSWFHDTGQGMTHPVGQKKPNAWGLFDVHGLLWEYCSDYYAADSYKASSPTDPKGPASGAAHTTRGGTYGSRPIFVRSAIRGASPDPAANKDVLSRFGFRVVMELQDANGKAAGND